MKTINAYSILRFVEDGYGIDMGIDTGGAAFVLPAGGTEDVRGADEQAEMGGFYPGQWRSPADELPGAARGCDYRGAGGGDPGISGGGRRTVNSL